MLNKCMYWVEQNVDVSPEDSDVFSYWQLKIYTKTELMGRFMWKRKLLIMASLRLFHQLGAQYGGPVRVSSCIVFQDNKFVWVLGRVCL